MSSLASKQSPNPDSPTHPVNSNANTSAMMRRVPFYLTLTVGAVAVILLAIFLVTALEWRQRPFFGAMMSPY
ncbi:MAG: hypothetical protein H0X30_33790, partial [Anaerolineae bacterium]|nr:hypothetical protein [Anaerolineae bacterium]